MTDEQKRRRTEAGDLISRAILLLEKNEDENAGEEEPGRCWLEVAERALARADDGEGWLIDMCDECRMGVFEGGQPEIEKGEGR